MPKLTSNITTRSDDKYGIECGVTVFPDRDRVPKVGVWVYDDDGRHSVRTLGFELTAETIERIRGGEDSDMSVSCRIYDLVVDTIEESDATMPNFE